MITKEKEFILFAILLGILVIFQRYLSLSFLENPLRVRRGSKDDILVYNKIITGILYLFVFVFIFYKRIQSKSLKKVVLYAIIVVSILPLFPFIFEDVLEAVLDPNGKSRFIDFFGRFIQLALPIGIVMFCLKDEIIKYNSEYVEDLPEYCSNCDQMIGKKDTYCGNCGNKV